MVKNLSVSTSDVVIKNLCTTVGPVEVCFQTLNPRRNVHMIVMQSDNVFGITLNAKTSSQKPFLLLNIPLDIH